MKSRNRRRLHSAFLACMVTSAAACQPIEYENPATPTDDGEAPVSEQHQAVTATGGQADLIRLVHQHTLELALYRAYFERRFFDAPQWTADGHGAFQWFEGSVGPGAIYSHEYVTSDGTRPTVAFAIYGAILPYWASHGYETLLGYPNSEEQDASDRSDRTPCASQGGTRQQLFGYVKWEGERGPEGSEVVLCWSPARGVWALPVEVAEGLAGQRYIERIPDLP